ncbi:MAG: hypothetical protein ABEJ90_04175 [Halobacterium sp.]
MTEDSSRLAWGVAAAAVAAAVVLAGYTVFVTGVPGAPTRDAGRHDSPPNAEIAFAPSEASMAVLYEGGDAVDADAVYIDVEGEPRQSWAGLDPDTAPQNPLDAGERVSVSSWEAGDTVRVVWSAGGDTDVLATYQPEGA